MARWRLDLNGAWRRSWLPALVVTLLVAFGTHSEWMQRLDNEAYDWSMRASVHSPSERITIVAIDAPSMAVIGPWPWSREVHARMHEVLKSAGAKVVGDTMFFSEPQVDPGLGYIKEARELVANSTLEHLPPLTANVHSALARDVSRLTQLLDTAANKLDSDRKLASALNAAGNTVLPMNFEIRDLPEKSAVGPLPEFVLRAQLKNVKVTGGAAVLDLPPAAANAMLPLPVIGEQASTLGFLNLNVDADGVVRSLPLVAQYEGRFFPSFALAVAARSRGIALSAIDLRLGEGVMMGGGRVSSDRRLRLYPTFYSGRWGHAAFEVTSFSDVLSGRVPPERFRDRIVLIGTTAPGIGATAVTPIASALPTVMVMAHAISSLIQDDVVRVPSWRNGAEAAIFALIALYLLAVLPRLRVAPAAIASVALLALLVLGEVVLLTTQAIWLRLMASALLLTLGYLALTASRLLAAEQAKRQASAQSAESNRMLGVAFQSQGQLDLAFDKFRLVPIDSSLLEPLYNLALDFDRRRELNKAGQVLDYIAQYAPGYRDVKERRERMKARQQTGALAGLLAGSHPELVSVGAEKRMLGHYEIECELGKGSMGVVYLGRDPKIGRVVAIKTMEFSKEFDKEDLGDVKARFFREAETAGRLIHPSIVTIFEAGEEADLAYIAMEFLKGHDLSRYTKPGALLQPRQALGLCARVADALAYAHAQGVVHRDIKPANIMWEPGSDTLKVTDFGIARIDDASRTRTGMVLGTPSYMSPEQLAGRKIDGRSDLFSVGVMLYQMLSGVLPFRGDSIADLMFKIANEPAPDILRYNPTLPESLLAVLRKALAKLPGQRYQDGTRLAIELRACSERIGSDIIDIGL